MVLATRFDDLGDWTVEPVHRANWCWEVGMNDDQIADAEKIRDYGMYVAYSTFSYCKNRLANKEDWECTHLVWVYHVSGKRESHRILGDLLLREQDLTRPIHAGMAGGYLRNRYCDQCRDFRRIPGTWFQH